MCEVGGLKVPEGNNYLRKRTTVLTTSKEFHSLLDARYCRKNHAHQPILGKIRIARRYQNLSSFAARYSLGFAKNVCYALMQSIETKERPCALEELCVPCYGVHERDQETVAGEVLKRRRYGTKQGPRPGDEYLVANPRSQYGRANTWKEIFKQKSWHLGSVLSFSQIRRNCSNKLHFK